MPASLARHKHVTQVKRFLLVVCRAKDSEMPDHCTDDVLQLCHGEVRPRTTSAPVSKRGPVQMHLVRCVQPPLWRPAVRIRKDRRNATLIQRRRGGYDTRRYLDRRQCACGRCTSNRETYLDSVDSYWLGEISFEGT
jgi:hypothetical protein